ncbi:CmpA/NrtA family ABC transporter substrate-binding protein [Methylobacterium thuringiense]|uniref:Nitrate/nitrite binding protein NrtA n=1 Tax=Methylobacterium thuringiense TaxID=1003091 RepID=A0ABQ4TJD9_9HYPH|nr:CmpA/NrtA family ABC transporter substrate-binding protein [Methylobacterium thuringiense]GJE55454.1 Nitrate/nitrite binding protein NrtA [Methylobacterium thuringiense]
MRVDLGYVPLTDAAPVLAAAELGFARDEGIDLVLTPEPSWATLRDRLALGHLDAAHMLAPLALATRLGLSGPRADLVAPMALNLNGNAITLSLPLWEAMAPETDDLDTVATAFARIARDRAGQGRPLTLATVHPFSCHSYQLRIFAERGGLDLAQAVRIVVVPPPQTVEAVASGEIDGVCVGAPWNSIAVAAGLGRIAALGCAIVPDCPEKVLAIHASQIEALAPLVEAVQRAGIWCADPANVGELAELLSERGGLGPDTDLIRRSLTGHLVMDSAGRRHTDPDYLRLGADVHRPRPEHGLWLAEQMAASGQIADAAGIAAACHAFYRTDLLKA